MAQLKDILGINARAADYLRGNRKVARLRADDKLVTKKMLIKHKLPHPRLLARLVTLRKVNNFDWKKIEVGFVIKPVAGLGGKGVLVVKRKLKDKDRWVLSSGKEVRIEDLRLHAADIIEGRFSRNDMPDTAMIEERVKIHPIFAKLAVGGTPDVRIIVYNRVPVMAMLRIPTEESGGRANLHQGAIGLGIDMATGITTFGVYKDTLINHFPETNKKVNGIVVPHWKKILMMAVETQIVSKLNYLSVDMLIDEEKGPLVLELNDQPGLSIQLANKAGLRKRLERVEGLEVETAEQGVNIGRTLFASKFASRVRRTLEGQVVVRNLETVIVLSATNKKISVLAKVDTGAYSTSIDRSLAAELGLLEASNVLFDKKFKSSLGTEHRTLIKLVFWLGGSRVVSRAGISDRHGLRRKILIGRRDLKGFLIDPLRYKTDYKIHTDKNED